MTTEFGNLSRKFTGLTNTPVPEPVARNASLSTACAITARCPVHYPTDARVLLRQDDVMPGPSKKWRCRLDCCPPFETDATAEYQHHTDTLLDHAPFDAAGVTPQGHVHRALSLNASAQNWPKQITPATVRRSMENYRNGTTHPSFQMLACAICGQQHAKSEMEILTFGPQSEQARACYHGIFQHMLTTIAISHRHGRASLQTSSAWNGLRSVQHVSLPQRVIPRTILMGGSFSFPTQLPVRHGRRLS
jgi:hypothetical protein